MKTTKSQIDDCCIMVQWLSDKISENFDIAYKASIEKGNFVTGSGYKEKPKTRFTCPNCDCVFGFKFENLSD